MSSGLVDRPAVGAGDPGRDVSAVRLRRWIHQRRLTAEGPRISASSLYVAALTLAVAVGVFGQRLAGVLWPATSTPMTEPAGTAALARLALIALAAYALVRRNGPLAISRAHLSWLFLAPVSRRGLLLPGLLGVLAAAAAVGGVLALAAVGGSASRPVGATTVWAAVTVGICCGAVAGLGAIGGQRRARVGRVVDLAAVAVAMPSAAVAIGLWRPGRALASVAGWVPAAAPVLAAGALVVTVGLVVATVRMLAGFPSHRVHDASVLRGSLLDAAVSVEPAFLADMFARRSWQRRTLRSAPVRAVLGLPVSLGPDLLVLRRRPARLGWLAAATLVPAVAVAGPPWVLVAVVLAGALFAADTTMDAVRRDSGQPALLRLLGLTGRQVLAGRLVVPVLLAAGWSAGALAVPALLGQLPPGPWWALGLALGPAAAVSAVRRSRTGYVRHDLMPIETPMGSLATGPLLWMLAGTDLLVLLALPAVLVLFGGSAPTWDAVLTQAVLATAGLVAYLLTRTDRTESRL